MRESLKTLVKIFEEMNADGWNTSQPLKWGFYFLDPDKSKLDMIYEELKEDDYTLENISLKDDEKWIMSVSKVDILTASDLYERNSFFTTLADNYEVEVYEGYDVVKVSDDEQ